MTTISFQSVKVLRACASEDIPEAGIKRNDIMYLVRDTSAAEKDRFFVVRWERVRWVCSCGIGLCDHKLTVNAFVFEQSRISMA